MNHAPEIPTWAAFCTAAFVLIGAGLALIGSFGLLRLRTFYQRVHAPTLGTTLGIGSVLIASMIFFSASQTRLVVHEILIAAFMVLTTPIALTMLARAALYRDRRESVADVPPRLSTAHRDGIANDRTEQLNEGPSASKET
jgi:multicomponent K+:H+ antiporter subunit G